MKSAPEISGLFGTAILLKGPHRIRSSRSIGVVFLRDRIAPTSAAYEYEHSCSANTSHLPLSSCENLEAISPEMGVQWVVSSAGGEKSHGQVRSGQVWRAGGLE
jgi:hypothetical protein